MFANQSNKNGIVIAIRNNGAATSFFDCISWSKFSYESEMLFIGGFNRLEICGLTVINESNNMKYDKWIHYC